MNNISNSSSAWSVFWSFVGNFFTAVKNLMQSITIFSIGGAVHCSLWDLCLGVIIMSAVIGQFIIFTRPVLADRKPSKEKGGD